MVLIVSLVLVVVSVVLVTPVADAAEETRPLVNLATGALRGVTLHSLERYTYAAFKGIPYARPPVGDLRFQPPKSHRGWEGVRDASQHGAVCPQFDMFSGMTRKGQEDCLFVNVYTPHVPRASDSRSGGGMPVMVWIHGGGFAFGDGNDDLFGPDYLMDDSVVVVTINYRLNLFGFLTTEDAVAPGNMGLRDQVAALQWVRDNIAQFGGNPRLVTVFGGSAGAASVSLLVVSPLATGLFQRAISQSGAATAALAPGTEQRNLAIQLADKFDCRTPDGAIDSAMIECLRRVPAESLLDAHGHFMLGFSKQFHPRVDIDAVTPVLPDHPNRLLQRGEFNHVPRMLGQMSHEGLAALVLLQNATLMEQMQAGNLEVWGSVELLGGGGIMDKTDRPLQVAAAVRDRTLAVTAAAGGDQKAGLEQLLGDRFFTLSIAADAELSSEYVPVYTYVVDHIGAGQMQMSDIIPDADLLAKALGAEIDFPADQPPTHGDELAYLFRGKRQTPPDPGSPSHEMIRLLVTLWTSFARLGYPTTDVLETPDWSLFTAQTRRHMRLNRSPSIDNHAFKERLHFWKSLPLREGWNAHLWQPSDTAAAKDEL